MIVESLYPEVADLYGELGNVMYLQRSTGCQVIETGLNQEPAFLTRDDIDMVYMGTMTERAQELVIERLEPHKEEIIQSIENGQRFLITGNALEIFGKEIEDRDPELLGGKDPVTRGLGIFGFHTERRMLHRFNSLFHGMFQAQGTQEAIDIVGFNSQFTQSFRDEELKPLFSIVRGRGFEPEGSGEGIRYRNFMATYIIGPLLVLNPPFTKYLLQEMGEKDVSLACEEAAFAAYEKRLQEYSEPDRGFVY